MMKPTILAVLCLVLINPFVAFAAKDKEAAEEDGPLTIEKVSLSAVSDRL